MSTRLPTRTVTAREANQGFSKLLREVEEGGSFVITKNGRRVATLTPIADAMTPEERKRKVKEFIAQLREGLPLGGRRFTRDEMQRFELPPEE